MDKSESIKELATALSSFQSSIDNIPKTETNPFFKNKYADIASVWEVIRKPLSDNGLSVSQHPEGGPETIKVISILMHKSGEWISSGYETKPVKQDPQGVGSAITYAKRYSIMGILGLSADIDDDGNTASNKDQTRQAQKQTPKQEKIQTVIQPVSELDPDLEEKKAIMRRHNLLLAEAQKQNVSIETILEATGYIFPITKDSGYGLMEANDAVNRLHELLFPEPVSA